jgi:hypothetical protein
MPLQCGEDRVQFTDQLRETFEMSAMGYSNLAYPSISLQHLGFLSD